MKCQKIVEYDITVIGGGPAGAFCCFLCGCAWCFSRELLKVCQNPVEINHLSFILEKPFMMWLVS